MNYYQVLGVSPNSSSSQIKKAYKKLALKYHPDKNSDHNKQKSKDKFTKITEAYAVLSNTNKRKDYDSTRLRQENQKKNQNIKRKKHNSYQWKNPEFDPNYKHVDQNPQFSSRQQNSSVDFGNIFNFNQFKSFQVPRIASNYINRPFGQFTFEMAEEIFNQAFNGFDQQLLKLQSFSKHNQALQLNNTQNYKTQQKKVEIRSINVRNPKNSILISQKTIQRNGRQILVKKYSITENGFTHTQTHEQFAH